MCPVEREYDYQPRWTTIVLGAVFFGVTTIVLAVMAAGNDRGLVINGIVKLGPNGATIFYWCLAACSLGFVAASVFMVYHRLTFQQRLIFGPKAMRVPASRWSRDEKEIAYRDIHDLSTTTVSGQAFLIVRHLGGKYEITASMLPSRAEFEEVRNLLTANVQESQASENERARS